jgi:hypothetical protein
MQPCHPHPIAFNSQRLGSIGNGERQLDLGRGGRDLTLLEVNCWYRRPAPHCPAMGSTAINLMKPFLPLTAALLLNGGIAIAQAYNFTSVTNAQSAITEALSWNLAGNTDKTCAALLKTEKAALALDDAIAFEAAVKAQAQALRGQLLRMNVFCPLQ